MLVWITALKRSSVRIISSRISRAWGITFVIAAMLWAMQLKAGGLLQRCASTRWTKVGLAATERCSLTTWSRRTNKRYASGKSMASISSVLFQKLFDIVASARLMRISCIGFCSNCLSTSPPGKKICVDIHAFLSVALLIDQTTRTMGNRVLSQRKEFSGFLFGPDRSLLGGCFSKNFHDHHADSHHSHFAGT